MSNVVIKDPSSLYEHLFEFLDHHSKVGIEGTLSKLWLIKDLFALLASTPASVYFCYHLPW